MPVDTDTGGMASVHSQLGRIEGILSTIVTEHARRITDQESIARGLRTDMTAMNVDLTSKITAVAGTAATNTVHITELRADLVDANNKSNSVVPRTAQVLSPIVAIAALIWSFIVGGR